MIIPADFDSLRSSPRTMKSADYWDKQWCHIYRVMYQLIMSYTGFLKVPHFLGVWIQLIFCDKMKVQDVPHACKVSADYCDTWSFWRSHISLVYEINNMASRNFLFACGGSIFDLKCRKCIYQNQITVNKFCTIVIVIIMFNAFVK